MTALPLAERELRVASRRASTYWSRFGFAFVGVAAAAAMLLISRVVGNRPAPGVLLSAWSTLLFLYFLLRGVRLTADCLSRERREGTLGLLFLTGLRARGIVLAKLIPPFIQCLSVMLALFPVLAISVLLGGIQAWEFVRMILALVITVLLALSIGIAISAFGRERKKSESTAGLIAALFWFGPPFLDQVIQRGIPALSGIFSVSMLGPSYLHTAALGPGIGSSAVRFWAAVLCNLAMIGMFQAIAIGKLGSSWQDEIFGLKRRWRDRWLERKLTWGGGENQVRSSLRTQRLNVAPFYWLIVRERWPQIRIWSALVFCIAASAGLAWLLRADGGFGQGWLLLTVGAVYLVIRVLVVDEASRAFMSQRSSGALEMLLATPLTVTDLVRGQWLALRRRLAAPAILFFGLCLAALVLAALLPTRSLFNFKTAELNAILLAMALMFPADILALGWVAMWLSLKCRRQADVAGSALARILLLPNLFWLFFVMVISGPASRGFLWNLSWWLFFGLVVDLFFILWCRWRLLRTFRRLATLEYLNSGPSGAWGRWLGTRYARWIRGQSSGPPPDCSFVPRS